MSRLVSDKYKAEEDKQLQNGTYKSKSDISKKGLKLALAFGIAVIVAIILIIAFM